MSIKTWASKDKLASADLNANFAAILAMNICNEDLTVYVDGSETEFDTLLEFKPTTLQVYISDGATGGLVRQQAGASYDYIEILDVDGYGASFKFNSVVPVVGSKLVVDYQKGIA